ncbi:MAG: DUF3426 domain-containing protein [Alphaproteobacteria bacterium]|nr:DUF3426 domain-containing protein [Alphaproteobacteria bacterium]
MILTCPQCDTRYTADASKFAPPGRKVRCAKCGHIWHQVAEPEAPEPAFDAPEPAPPAPQPATPPPVIPRREAYQPPRPVQAPVEQDHEEAPRPRRRWLAGAAVGIGWMVLAGAILLIGWSAISFRQQVAEIWPQAASLYAPLGLQVNARGIQFSQVASHREMEDGQFVLAITGRIENITNREVAVPNVVVTLYGADERELYHWSFAPSVSTLAPGKKIPFLTRVSSPPPGAKHLELRFADGKP